MREKVSEVIQRKLSEAYDELLESCGKEAGGIAPSEEIELDRREEDLMDAVCKWLEVWPAKSDEEGRLK